LLTAALASLSATPALASVSEPQQGGQILSEIQAGKLKGSGLSSTQYQRVGQYLMGHALGSTQTYEAMDSQMDRVMGQSVSGQMYLYMGERYLGKNASPNSSYTRFYGWMASMMSRYGGSYAAMMGSYMMGAYRSLSGNSSVPYAGMMGGYPSRQNGQSNGTTTNPLGGMMGYSYGAHGTSSSGGWPTAAVLAVTALGLALLGGGLAFALPRIRRRRGGPATPAAAGRT
jgi:hypothetical protein